MKILLLILFAATTSFAQDLSKVEWLTGAWTRTNAKPGRSGIEIWTKKNNELIGKGVTMKGTDTAFVEKLKIVVKDGKLFYVADVPENKTTVWFEFTQLTNKSFVCENPKHDFPKTISYELDGDKLRAVISGDGKTIDYLFVRKR